MGFVGYMFPAGSETVAKTWSDREGFRKLVGKFAIYMGVSVKVLDFLEAAFGV